MATNFEKSAIIIHALRDYRNKMLRNAVIYEGNMQLYFKQQAYNSQVLIDEATQGCDLIRTLRDELQPMAETQEQ